MVFYLHFTKHFMPVLHYLKYINWLFWLWKTSTIKNEMNLSKPVVFKSVYEQLWNCSFML